MNVITNDVLHKMIESAKQFLSFSEMMGSIKETENFEICQSDQHYLERGYDYVCNNIDLEAERLQLDLVREAASLETSEPVISTMERYPMPHPNLKLLDFSTMNGLNGPLNQKVNEPILLRKAHIEIELFFEDIGNVLLKEQDRIILATRNAIGRYTHLMQTAEETRFQVFDPIVGSDDFGDYEFDPLFGIMRIWLVMHGEDNTTFPQRWRMDRDSDLSFGPRTRAYLDSQSGESDGRTIRFGKEFHSGKIISLSQHDDHSDSLDDGNDVLPPLEHWLVAMGNRHHQAERYDDWLKALHKEHVFRLQDLLSWSSEQLKSCRSFTHTLVNVLNKELTKLRLRSQRSNSDHSMTTSELFANWHKVKRYIYYQSSGGKDHNLLSPLDRKAVEAAFEELKSDADFEGDDLLDKIQSALTQFLHPHIKFVKRSRGIILYGPPGTGKTTIIEKIRRKVGLTEIVEPLVSTQLNSELVGQTEKKILAIFRRGILMRHLTCAVVIDEIDALVKKRTDDSSDHKTDALTALIGVVDGINDVPNVNILACTNRYRSIDEAFMRRARDHFFVGRPGPSARFKIMKRISEVSLSGRESPKLTEQVMGQLIRMTTNFSGAAMADLRTQLIIQFTESGSSHITEKQVYDAAIDVARKFGVQLGNKSLPQVMSHNSTVYPDFERLHSPRIINDLSGLVLVDLDAFNIQLARRSNPKHQVWIPSERSNTFGSTKKECIETAINGLVFLAMKTDIDSIHYFDREFLNNKEAYDTKKQLEVLNEYIGEARAYDKEMILFDLDSLIEVNVSVSESSMGPTESYSIRNHDIWTMVISTLRDVENNANSGSPSRFRVVLSSMSFLISSFKSSLDFPRSVHENEKLKRSMENAIIRTCRRCKQQFSNEKNDLNSCNHHPEDAAVMEITVNKITGEKTAIQVEEREVSFWDKHSDRYKWSCCGQNYGSHGCTSGQHVA